MTTARALVLAVVLATAAVAGCIGGDDEASDGSEDLDEAGLDENEDNGTEKIVEPEPVLQRTWHNGTIEGATIPDVGWYCTPTGPCENTLEFEVPAEAEAIHVEAVWEQDANAWFNVSGPECETAYVVFELCSPSEDTDGASPLAIHIEDGRTNVTGTWTAGIWADEPTPTKIEVTIVATVVEEGPVPETLSATGGDTASQG